MICIQSIVHKMITNHGFVAEFQKKGLSAVRWCINFPGTIIQTGWGRRMRLQHVVAVGGGGSAKVAGGKRERQREKERLVEMAALVNLGNTGKIKSSTSSLPSLYLCRKCQCATRSIQEDKKVISTMNIWLL